jgi:hypothetical protein
MACLGSPVLIHRVGRLTHNQSASVSRIPYSVAARRVPKLDILTPKSRRYRRAVIVYSPSANWTRATGDCRQFQCTNTSTNIANSTITYTFTDDNIILVFSKGNQRGQAQILFNGSPVATIDQYTPSCCQWQVFWPYKFGSVATRTLTIRVLGTHSPGSLGNYIDLDAIVTDFPTQTYNSSADVSTFDDTAGSYIAYSNAWQTGANTNLYGGHNQYSNVLGNEMNFAFVGGEITYIYSKGVNRGEVQVTIDGVDKNVIDQYSAPCCIWQTFDRYTGLGPGIHDLHLSVLNQSSQGTATNIEVDALQILNCPSAPVHIQCRAYAYARVDHAHDFTGVQGFIGYSDAPIRDNGITAEVLWIGDSTVHGILGDPNFKNGAARNVIEAGLRKDPAFFAGRPYSYYAVYPSNNAGYQEHRLIAETSGHTFEIAATSDEGGIRWHVYKDGADITNPLITNVDLNNGGFINAGGEVSDYNITGAHNGMGPNSFQYFTDFGHIAMRVC